MLDPQLYMQEISFSSQSHTYLLETDPTIRSAIESLIFKKLRNKISKYLKIEILINLVDLKNKIGFGKEDELYCQIETSMIVDTTVDKKQINKNVRTLAKNNKNLSPLISTAGKIILEQCLEQHAENIVKEL